MTSIRKTSTAKRPKQGVTAWLATIPRRTVEVVIEHKDEATFGKFDSLGKPVPPRIEYQGRTARRAYGRRYGVPTPTSALATYRKPDPR